MNDELIYRFKIDSEYNPETIPMSRLAEYMTQLAILLGNNDHVHFYELKPGSVAIDHKIDGVARQKVASRLEAVQFDTAPDDVNKAVKVLNEMLRDDNGIGELTSGNNVVIPFPGKQIPRPKKIGPFNQEGSLDGILNRLGGKDETKHAHFTSPEGVEWSCELSEGQAIAIAPNIFGPTLRVHGNGKWIRTEDGKWELLKFKLHTFKKLEEKELREAIEGMRKIPGSGWGRENDPIGFLLDIRNESDETH